MNEFGFQSSVTRIWSFNGIALQSLHGSKVVSVEVSLKKLRKHWTMQAIFRSRGKCAFRNEINYTATQFS